MFSFLALKFLSTDVFLFEKSSDFSSKYLDFEFWNLFWSKEYVTELSTSAFTYCKVSVSIDQIPDSSMGLHFVQQYTS